MHDLRPTQARSGALREWRERGAARLDAFAVFQPTLWNEVIGVFEVLRIAVEGKVCYPNFGLELLMVSFILCDAVGLLNSPQRGKLCHGVQRACRMV
jgi:hypothetical protein